MNTKPAIRPRLSRRALRRTVGIAGAVVLAVTGALVPTGPALAADGPFNINGVVPDVAPASTELPDASGNVKELGPKNASSTKIGVIHKAAVPMLDTTNPNGQVDLRRAWLGTAREGTHDWLYFAWERDANSGSGFIGYEFMQNPVPAGCAYATATAVQLTANCNPWANRKAGDFMILWDQSGGSLDLFLRTWSGTAPNLTLSPGVALNASVSQAAYSADGFRGEAAVDLTATVFGGSTACKSFANTIPSTVTGNSDTADYKDTILQQTPPITNCTSSIATTPKTGAGEDIPGGGLSIGSGVVAVKDQAVVTLNGGSATPAGSVSFFLCKVDDPAPCTAGSPISASIGSTALSGDSYPATVTSPTAYVTSAGRYCWRSVFTGDSGNGIPGSSENGLNECFVVNPVTPTLSTTAGPDKVLGQSVSDSADLGGTATQPANPVINTTGASGAPAGGSITFKLYGPDSCTSLAHTTAAVSVTGNGTYNTPVPGFTPSAAGDYHWVATYSGSSPNTNGLTHNALCNDTAEDVSVTTVASSLTSAQTWVPNDSVTVSAPAGGNLAGTVYFDLFASANCSGDAIYSTSQAVSGASPQTVGTSNTAAQDASGTFSWRVRYASTNLAQRDIPNSCHETSGLTIENGGTITSP